MGNRAFAELLYGFPMTQTKVDDAAREKLEYLNSMPRVRDNFDYFRNYAQLNGFIKTKFGRYLHLPDLPTATDAIDIARGRRRAGNFPIQGLAADIFKIALNRLLKRFRDMNWDIYCPGLIHDEVLLFVNKKHHPYKIIRAIKECMELNVPGFSPLFTGIAVANSWGESKNGPYELPVRLAEQMAQMDRDNKLPEIKDMEYRDYIYNEKVEYLKGRFRSYLVEMGFDWDNVASNNIGELLKNMKSMFIGTEIRSMYAPKDKSIDEHSKLGLAFVKFIREETGVDLSETLTVVKSNVEVDNVVDLAEYMTSMQVINDIYGIDHESNDEEDVEADDSFVDMNEYSKYLREKTILDTQKVLNESTGVDFLIVRSEIYINITNLTKNGLVELTNHIRENSKDTNYFKVILKYGSNLIETEYRLDNIDRDTISNILHQNLVA